MSQSLFKQLHQQSTPLLLGNVWDAHSAQLAEKAGFAALGSSSHAIANLLGYEDGENIAFEELFFIVERIVKAVKIPVSVDFEAGYANDPATVAKYVKKLSDIGVAGINLEDGQVENGKRSLGSSQLLADKIKAIKSVTDIYINARTDTYVTKQENALKQSIERALIYQEAGADGIFVPVIETKADIQQFTTEVALPLNVFLTPNLPQYDELGELGVKRLSHGAKLYEWLMKKAEEELASFKKQPILPK
ncbi:isocitrate lyase/phosphoenolpyruvate mutase family protein [Sphingobacterium spiritivorum]|uniref:isocitrate lyase/PEP mutase family protein n=1 Tax=Sphingobacterium spiritivorum TaxID=258 RepID=UPI00191A28DC|nr:isocitrate lyase/phosphoenolpyruvate mutase family protein [Sphingobacterium spiritivorum]QQT24643.1 isocitrate lyase/phosphoenolpyruvate mutase family protein [Sphingobacterium spiritivorum]